MYFFPFYLFSHSPDEIGLSQRTVPDFQSDIHVPPLAFDVVGIERFRIPSFQDTAFATRLTIVQTFPGIEHIGLPLFLGGVIYLWWLHTIL